MVKSKKHRRKQEKSQKNNPVGDKPENILSMRHILDKLPGAAMRVKVTEHGIQVQGDERYAVSIPPNGVIIVYVREDMFSKLSSAKMALTFGFEWNDEKIIATWPNRFKYLSLEQQKDLNSIDIPTRSSQHIMLTVMPIEEIGLRVYKETNIANLIDAYLEIIWHEFAIETELEQFNYSYVKDQKPIQNERLLFLGNVKSWLNWECLRGSSRV